MAVSDALFEAPFSLRSGSLPLALFVGTGAVGSAPDFLDTWKANGGVLGLGLVRTVIGFLPVTSVNTIPTTNTTVATAIAIASGLRRGLEEACFPSAKAREG